LEQKILNTIKIKSTITREEIAKELNITADTVKEYLRKLKDKGLLIRIGGRKIGYWDIKE
jgi:ATP-dependent DNA helicase RecG